MLILTRKCGENLIIGEEGPNQIILHVLGIKGSQARLGIDAPKDVPVHREEIYKRIQAEKQNAESEDDDDNTGNE